MDFNFRKLGYGRKSYNNIPIFIKREIKKSIGVSIHVINIRLAIDFFVFFIKKLIVKNDEIQILNLGKFKKKKFKKGFKITFISSALLRHVINREEKKTITSKYNRCNGDVEYIINNTAKCMGMKPQDVSIVFGLFVQGIINELKTNKFMKIRDFGILYLHEVRKIHNFDKVMFFHIKRFLDELNNRSEEIYASKRVTRLLKYNEFSKKIDN